MPDQPQRLPRFSLRSLILLVTLAGSGYGLWARWEPWAMTHEHPLSSGSNRPSDPLQVNVISLRFSDNEQTVTVKTSVTGQDVFSFGSSERIHFYALDVLTGKVIHEESGTDIYGMLPLPLSADKCSILSRDESRRADVLGWNRQLTLRVSSRRRPENWWGVAWIPEFWLTTVSGFGLLWSVWRDRKMAVQGVARG